MLKTLQLNQLTKEFRSHIVAFTVAEVGACGNSATVGLLTDKKEYYEISYIDEQLEKKLVKKFDILEQCLMSVYDKTVAAPADWVHTYMGMGNHLFMREWLDVQFYKYISETLPESCINMIWKETIMNILDQLATKKSYIKESDSYRTAFSISPKQADRKETLDKGFIRELLYVNWDRKNSRKEKIVSIGINPSTAQTGKSDRTMTKLCRFLDMYGFNNVTMLNLFEGVSPDQDKLNLSTSTDFLQKREILDEADIILLVWGRKNSKQKIEKAKGDTTGVLAKYADKLYCIKSPKGSYPMHPCYMPYASEIVPLTTAKDFSVCGLVKR